MARASPRPHVGAPHAIQLPDGAEPVEQRTGGSRLCFDVCPSVHARHYITGRVEPGANEDTAVLSLSAVATG